MKRHILILCFLLFVSYLSGQNTYIDSLQNVLKTTAKDETKAAVMTALSREYENIDRFKAFDFGKQALALAEKLNDKNKIGDCCNNLGDLYWYSGDYAKSSDYY